MMVSLKECDNATANIACDDIEGEFILSGSECSLTCDNVDGDVTVTGKATVNCENVDVDVICEEK